MQRRAHGRCKEIWDNLNLRWGGEHGRERVIEYLQQRQGIRKSGIMSMCRDDRSEQRTLTKIELIY